MIDLAHIHPMLMHFPLALLPVALSAQAITIARGQSLFERSCTAQTGFWLTILAAVSAIAAAVFGDQALDIAREAGVPMAQMEGHEELGMLSAWLLGRPGRSPHLLYRKQSTSRALTLAVVISGVALLALLFTTVWFGGQLVYELGVNVKV
ncbi:MAG: DUF2231 domain-containing protein [Sedimenticolaceae bacterium]